MDGPHSGLGRRAATQPGQFVISHPDLCHVSVTPLLGLSLFFVLKASVAAARADHFAAIGSMRAKRRRTIVPSPGGLHTAKIDLCSTDRSTVELRQSHWDRSLRKPSPRVMSCLVTPRGMSPPSANVPHG